MTAFILYKLKVCIANLPTIYCDNIDTTYLCTNLVFHSKIKHAGVDFYFVKNRKPISLLRVFHVSSKDQLANNIIKPLSQQQLEFLQTKLGAHPRLLSFKGVVNGPPM